MYVNVRLDRRRRALVLGRDAAKTIGEEKGKVKRDIKASGSS